MWSLTQPYLTREGARVFLPASGADQIRANFARHESLILFYLKNDVEEGPPAGCYELYPQYPEPTIQAQTMSNVPAVDAMAVMKGAAQDPKMGVYVRMESGIELELNTLNMRPGQYAYAFGPGATQCAVLHFASLTNDRVPPFVQCENQVQVQSQAEANTFLQRFFQLPGSQVFLPVIDEPTIRAAFARQEPRFFLCNEHGHSAMYMVKYS
jgi:hypothetical protein